MPHGYPRRIVCLTEETTEWLYALGEAERIVGISAYTERPPQAKAEKPVVSAFIGGHVGKIKALKPDLVIGFSDVQATLARDLIAANLPVLITNQRSVEDILDVLGMLGRLVGATARAQSLIDGYRRRIDTLRAANEGRYRPKVYFEEWDEPMISGIQWVSELIEIAGGRDIFADRAKGKSSQERGVKPEEVMARGPELMIGCWCGKPLDRNAILARPGFADLPALRHRQLHEVDPAIILQPGPACLTDGLDTLARLVEGVR